MTSAPSSPEAASLAEALHEMTDRYERLVQNLSILSQMDDIDDVRLDLDEICRRMVESIASGLSVENCSLMLLDPGGEHLVLRAACSPFEDAGKTYDEQSWLGKRFRIGEGVVGAAAASGEMVCVEDVSRDHRFTSVKGSQVAVGSLISFPLKVEDRVLGVLNLSHSRPRFFSIESQRALALAANRAARLLSTHMLYERLRKSEESYRLVTENAGDGILVLDRTARILQANAAVSEITGVPRSGFLEGSVAWESIVHPDDRPALHAHRQRLLEVNAPGTVEYRILDTAGQVHYVEDRGAPLYEDEGKVAGIVSIIRDISDRKQAEKERKELEVQVRQVQKLESLAVLAGGVAHDFNNLLMGITGNLDLALAKLPAESSIRPRLVQIGKTAERAAGLAKQMLAYSGRGKFHLQEINLSELIGSMLKILTVSIPRNARLQLELLPKVALIEGDESQIRQVVAILVTNAAEALGERNGTIVITCGAMQCERTFFEKAYLRPSLAAGAYAFVRVADTGCGMNEETLDRIFDPFFSTKFPGRGLGLPAALGIVRGHNGAIAAESAPGKGSTFQVVLPCGRPASSAEPNPSAPKRAAKRAASLVLFVDDDATVLEIGKLLLEQNGFEVLSAESGQDALRIFRQNAEDIAAVILDLTMPEMNGEQVLAYLRAIREDVPIIISSGYDEAQTAATLQQNSHTTFLHKPYSSGKLLAKVREVLL